MSDAADWFSSNLAAAGRPHELTTGQRRCLNVLQCVTAPSGLYNLSCGGNVLDMVRLEHDNRVSTLFVSDLSTYDNSGLTRLVIAAHQHLVRVTISPWHPHLDETRARARAEHLTREYEFIEPIEWDAAMVGVGVMEIALDARDATPNWHDRHPDILDLFDVIGKGGAR